MTRLSKVPLTFFIVFSVTLPLSHSASSPLPPDLPQSQQELGSAFFNAWLGFRRDLDIMGSPHVSPAQLNSWFASMPRFLAEDAARLATSPPVVLAAANRLAELATPRDRRFLAELLRHHREDRLHGPISALCIRAGDRKVESRIRTALTRTPTPRSIEAAAVLARAGIPQGRAYLRRLVKTGGWHVELAAEMLGRYGAGKDDALLVKALSNDPQNPLLIAARGEIALKNTYPDHYRMLLRRFEVASPMTAVGSQHTTWLNCFFYLLRRTTPAAKEVIGAIRGLGQRGTAAYLDGETWRRQVQALADFWQGAEGVLARDSSALYRPTSFAEAKSHLRVGRTRTGVLRGPGARISSQISICAWAGKKLGHTRLAAPTPNLRVVTPGANRATDGNLATSWHCRAGDTLTIEHEQMATAKTLWLMNTCADDSGSRINEVSITGYTKGRAWTVTTPLSTVNHYFQPIPIPRQSTQKLDIGLLRTTSKAPSCITEIRLEMK